MSSDSQLGLFSGPVTTEATSSNDVATDSANSGEAATAKPVAVAELAPLAEPLDPGYGEARRRGRAILPANPYAEERYLSVQDVARRYAISIQTVWRHTKHNPAFPKPIKILNGSTRWRLSDIIAFEVARREAGR
ncbi:hypothetical protein RHAB21_03731 [Pseudorhizobium halotolerans]|uniref:AlpA family transcriptional regulator n=1 Tax=Pseudorhizobium halotolerans TaxID=1233081 RepID=A0ABN7JTB9_9HYPH|nr:hypothetical protein [Pseudorhizobium halotolerans]CAD7046848.1 hypothetical protein RHAB21_03731 [Pseudorhizobium halotolerans]